MVKGEVGVKKTIEIKVNRVVDTGVRGKAQYPILG